MLKGDCQYGMYKKRHTHTHTLAGAGGTTERVPLKAEICFTRDRSLSCRLAMRSPAAVRIMCRWDVRQRLEYRSFSAAQQELFGTRNKNRFEFALLTYDRTGGQVVGDDS
jgi:hypothetical protein